MILKGIAQRLEEKLIAEGRLTSIPENNIYTQEYMAKAAVINEESERRQRLAWAYINDLESGRRSLELNREPIYKKIFNYFSKLF